MLKVPLVGGTYLPGNNGKHVAYSFAGGAVIRDRMTKKREGHTASALAFLLYQQMA